MKFPKRASQADVATAGAGRRRFRVSSAWGRSRSHLSVGYVAAVPARMDRKWSLNVRMARLVALRRWTWGGTEAD